MGDNKLITDYWSLPHKTNDPEELELNEVMYHKAKKSKINIQEEIFNPEDYDSIPDRY